MTHHRHHAGALSGVPAAGDAFSVSRKTVQTANLLQHERALSGWQQSYDQLSKGRFSGQVTEALVGDVQLFEESMSQAVFEVGAGRSGVLALGVFSKLDGEARWRGHAIGASHVTAFSDHAGLELRTPPDSSLLGVSVPVAMLAAGEGEAAPDAGALLAGMATHVHSPALAAGLRRHIGTALHALVRQPDQLAQAEARRQLESELAGLVGEYLEVASAGPAEPEARKARKVVGMARDYIEANASRPLTVPDLCKQTFTSRRTLQYCFARVIGVSPAAYLKVVRLNGLRRDLLDTQGGTTIRQVAARWGFWHLSQLAADYKRLFGELPSETIRCAGRRSAR